LNEEGIHCVLANRFTPVLSHIHNNRDHRKITVIDGKIGFTGGVNIADEYINAYEKYGHWKDSAIRMEGEAVKNLTALFLTNWNMQAELSLDIDTYMDMVPLDEAGREVVAVYGDGPSPWYQESIGKNVYLNMIHGAREYVYITTPYLICDSELMNTLQLSARKGVDIRLITPHIPDKKPVYWMTRSSYRPLIFSGVKIYEYTPGFIHAKNFICDDKFAVCGTINLDYRSLVHHFECGAWMYDTDCIKDMKTDFLQTQAKSEQIILERSDLIGGKRLAAELMKVFAPLF
jgi:cardiolipin synthase